MRGLWIVAAVLVACGPKGTDSDPTGTGTASGTTTGGTTSTTGLPTGTPTTGTTTTGPDCSGGALSWSELPIPSSEDFTIGTDGLLYGVSTQSQALIRTDHAGNTEILAPGISSWGRGTRFLPSGDLVVAEPDSGTLLRFDTTTWGHTVLANSLAQPNGIAIGDDGMIYLTQATGRVVRVDPDTAGVTELYDTPVSTDGITFDPDYRTLYWNSESGEIIKAVIDDQGVVIDGPELLTTITGNGGAGFTLLDGMTSDACGNLYVVRMDGRIVRVFPDGTQEVFADLTGGSNFISAANFGNGHGGFELTNLYVMDLNGGVFEVVTDVPGKWEPHW